MAVKKGRLPGEGEKKLSHEPREISSVVIRGRKSSKRKKLEGKERRP